MNRITPNAASWFAFVGFTFYWALVAIVPIDIVKGLFNNLSFGVAVMVVITWFPAAWKCFREGTSEGEWMLVIAIFLAFLVLSYQRVIVILLAILDRPVWLVDGPLTTFIPYSITLIGLMFLLAPGVARGAAPTHYWKMMLAAGAIGGAVFGFLIGRALPFY